MQGDKALLRILGSRPKRWLSQTMSRIAEPKRLAILRRLPIPDKPMRRHARPPLGAWSAYTKPTPDHLRTIPGIWRDEEEEERVHVEKPLYRLNSVMPEAMNWLLKQMWSSVIPTYGRLMRAHETIGQVNTEPQSVDPSLAHGDPHALTQLVKARAAEVGLSAVGVAQVDPKYVFAEYETGSTDDRIIVCILEQAYEVTQTIPSEAAERTVMTTYATLMNLAAELAKTIQASGHMAEVHDPGGQELLIHYAVEAGLGQLGLNGQLLTPHAGSRCRLLALRTDAPLLLDKPKDFGIHAICDACKVCVKRCPTTAIPGKRKPYRGVTKAKIDTARCLPVVAQVDGCGICMKVCPVQRYGLEPVVDEFNRSGQILGKGTDDLEGYKWPLTNTHMGPRDRPRISEEFKQPEGVSLEILDRPDPEATSGSETLLPKAKKKDGPAVY